jgi:hypothetical protein
MAGHRPDATDGTHWVGGADRAERTGSVAREPTSA